VSISIAGAQEKTALFRDDDGWAVPIGATATTHILKPAIGNVDGLDLSTSVENEHFCLALAGELGLPVARSEMQTFGRRRCLIVERFDRQWTRNGRLLRLPQEDFCQALGVPSARKYEAEGGTGLAQMSRILTGSTIVNDREILFRAAVIFWLLAATDGHAKNFSLFLQPGDNFRMTPLYDILSVQPLLDDRSLQRREARMAMAAGRNRHYRLDEIQPRHFEETGEIMGLNRKKVAALLGELADHGSRAAERVSNRLSHCIPDGLRTSIINGMLRRLELINRTWSGI
jgi:serine/threonine-protein kinase HipA